jgi:hypothetical protein
MNPVTHITLGAAMKSQDKLLEAVVYKAIFDCLENLGKGVAQLDWANVQIAVSAKAQIKQVA